ncbi:hypothetical protein GGI35DRAFT_437550, partial [Trichoderma velutinum]
MARCTFLSVQTPHRCTKGCPNQPRLAQSKVLPAKSQKSWANILSDAPTERRGEERRGLCLWVWHVALLLYFGCRYCCAEQVSSPRPPSMVNGGFAGARGEMLKYGMCMYLVSRVIWKQRMAEYFCSTLVSICEWLRPATINASTNGNACGSTKNGVHTRVREVGWQSPLCPHTYSNMSCNEI